MKKILTPIKINLLYLGLSCLLMKSSTIQIEVNYNVLSLNSTKFKRVYIPNRHLHHQILTQQKYSKHLENN